MAEPQTQKKNKKAKKKPEVNAGQPRTLSKNDKMSAPLGDNNSKQNLGNNAGAVTATNDFNKETVDESANNKKKKSKKKSKEVQIEAKAENKNSESLLNFSESGIHLLNHPEISVTIASSIQSKDDGIKSETDKIPPASEEKQEVIATAKMDTNSKKKKKKKKKNSDNTVIENKTSTETTLNETNTVTTPTYTKVVTSDNTCVLVVNNETIPIDSTLNENSESKKNKKTENCVKLSMPSEQQFGDVLLTRKFSPDTSMQFNNSVSIFPVLTDLSTNAPLSQPTVTLSLNPAANSNNVILNTTTNSGISLNALTKSNIFQNTEVNLSVAKPVVNEDVKEASEESKSKAQLKAERRAKQEAQRAAKEVAKLAKGNAKGDTSSSTPKDKNIPPKEKSTPKESNLKTNEVANEKGPTKVIDKESFHKVKLFSHLPQCKIFDINAKIHPAILEIGFQYNKGIMCGSNARCIALLDSLKEVIKDYVVPPEKNFCRDLESNIKSCLTFLNNCRPLSVSMLNAVKFLKHEINRISSDIEITEIKKQLCDFIDKFVKEDILIAKEAISDCASSTVNDGDVILVFAFSSLVRDILCKAHDKKKKFRVIVVDSRPKLEGLKMLRCLVRQNVQCSYISINAISYIIKEVTSVFLGAHALLSNGYVMSRLGSKQIALVASTYSVPVFICCESYKLCERMLTDSFVQNELGESDDFITSSVGSNDSLKNWHELPSFQPLNLLFDVTSPDLIQKIITEKGALACTCVPVMCRVKYGALSQLN